MHHPAVRCALLMGTLLHGTCHAQHKTLPNGLYFGARLLSESDGAFTSKREQPLASYPFRCGIGPQVLYVKHLNSGLGWGIETGGWIFWNTDTDRDPSGVPSTGAPLCCPCWPTCILR